MYLIPRRANLRKANIKTITAATFLVYGILILCGYPSFADEGSDGTALSLRWENDAFGGTNANYTNGLSLSMTRPGPGLTKGLWTLLGQPEGRHSSAYDLVQLQFTPDDIGRSDPDPSDRPYAGILYLGITTFLERKDSLHGLKLFFGVVGPASLSEALQKTAHRTVGYNLPQGWNHQIKNEPIVNLMYEYRRRIELTADDAVFEAQLVPNVDCMLGNYLIRADTGLEFRVGYQLPDDFGETSVRGIGVLPFHPGGEKRHAWGCHIFTGIKASLIGWDITLDGNTFARSRSVDKRPFVPAAEFGASIWTRSFRTTFSYTMLGKEFYGQKDREDYGSLLLTVSF